MPETALVVYAEICFLCTFCHSILTTEEEIFLGVCNTCLESEGMLILPVGS